MRLLVAGDWHGNVKHAIHMINTAGDMKINHVFVVGDFGLWTHKMDGHVFLDEVQDAARVNNLSVYAIGGNHENWDHWNWVTENAPTHKGFGLVRSRILLAPKAHAWKWAGKSFGSAGGAVSVDREWRLAQEQGGRVFLPEWGIWSDGGRGSGEKTLWWPNEQFTEKDLIKYQTHVGEVDYLFTHDCSDNTPFQGRLKPDLDSKAHRQRIDKVIKASKATMQFHGHMHTRYDWMNTRSHGFHESDPNAVATRTIGLDCDGNKDSWGTLEVETGEWLWPDEVRASIERRKAAKALADSGKNYSK